MPSLASCPACGGFIVDLGRHCIHCGAAPRPGRTLARFLAVRVFGAAAAVTLMACYGAPADYYDCTQNGTCGCISDDECELGSYCADDPYDYDEYGTCTWSSGCTEPGQCGWGMTCDLSRQTCVPGCAEHADCYSGELCDLDTMMCVPGTPCLYDGGSCGVGARCDQVQGVCVPCDGAACGSCTEEVTCTATAPTCFDGATVPGVEAGCYTGACVVLDACLAAECAALDEPACLASDICAPTYAGIDCTDPEGDPCDETTATCTCESFEFAGCVAVPP